MKPRTRLWFWGVESGKDAMIRKVGANVGRGYGSVSGTSGLFPLAPSHPARATWAEEGGVRVR